MKLTNVIKYNQPHDNFTRNVKVGMWKWMFIVSWKQAEKRQFFRHMTESKYNQAKYNRRVRLLNSGGAGPWIVVPSLPPWFHFRLMAPILTLCVGVCSSFPPFISLHVHVMPNNIPRFKGVWPGLASPRTCWMKDRITRSISNRNSTGSHFIRSQWRSLLRLWSYQVSTFCNICYGLVMEHGKRYSENEIKDWEIENWQSKCNKMYVFSIIFVPMLQQFHSRKHPSPKGFFFGWLDLRSL